MCALLAARDMTTERRRAAALDCRHHLQLAEVDMAGIGPAPCRAMVAEDVRDLQRWRRQVSRFRLAARLASDKVVFEQVFARLSKMTFPFSSMQARVASDRHDHGAFGARGVNSASCRRGGLLRESMPR